MKTPTNIEVKMPGLKFRAKVCRFPYWAITLHFPASHKKKSALPKEGAFDPSGRLKLA